VLGVERIFSLFTDYSLLDIISKMSSSVIYVLDLKGKVLISRNYRGDLDTSVIDKFMPLVMEREEEGNMTPIIQHGNVTFAFIKCNNLYLVSVTKKNANVTMVFQFLHKVVQVSLMNYHAAGENADRGNVNL
jgi:AP-1 complex subunit mu